MTVEPASRPIPIKTWLCATSLVPESPETETLKTTGQGSACRMKSSGCTIVMEKQMNCVCKNSNQMKNMVIDRSLARVE
jgi:hypothetical protein